MKYFIMDVEVPESIIEKFDDLLYAYLDEDDKLNFAIKEMKSTTIEKTNELLNIIHEIHNKTFVEEDLINNCEVKVDKILAAKECLRCGKEEPHYCETCFQEIIAENARLQKQIHDIKRILEKYEEISNIRKNKEIFPKCVICGEYIHNYIRSSKSICDKENCRKEYQRRRTARSRARKKQKKEIQYENRYL